MSDTTDEYIIRALVALIEQQDRLIAKLEEQAAVEMKAQEYLVDKVEKKDGEVAYLERQLDAERKAAKHLIEGLDG